MCECRNYDKAEHQRSQQGKSFGESERPEKFSFSSLHGKNRQEAHDGRCQRRHDGRADLDRGLIDHFEQRLSFNPFIFRHLKVPDDILREDNPDIDHHPDGNCDTGQGHHIGIDPKLTHHDECHEYPDGQ